MNIAFTIVKKKNRGQFFKKNKRAALKMMVKETVS